MSAHNYAKDGLYLYLFKYVTEVQVYPVECKG